MSWCGVDLVWFHLNVILERVGEGEGDEKCLMFLKVHNYAFLTLQVLGSNNNNQRAENVRSAFIEKKKNI